MITIIAQGAGFYGMSIASTEATMAEVCEVISRVTGTPPGVWQVGDVGVSLSESEISAPTPVCVLDTGAKEDELLVLRTILAELG